MGRITLVEQKRLQWAKEREEMAKLKTHWESTKNYNGIQNTTIRTRLSSREVTSHRKPLRTSGHYGSTSSLRSLETAASTSLQSLDFSTATAAAARGGSMINIVERTELQDGVRKRSPSLPPIYTKDHQLHQEHRDLEVEGSRYTNYPRTQKHPHRQSDRNILAQFNRYEEREGETSGYASDSIEPHQVIRMNDSKKLLPLDKTVGADGLWQNGYSEVSDTSLPPSRRLSELNRARWGSVWYQENHNPDAPPPSWLERGLSRLDNSSQILVINHESASSPDSSTTGSTGSDSKTYLRGQNLPVDGRILQEREIKRQKALELQNAIKQQLEEKDRKRREERERKLREELEEEERIRRERNQEKERFEEEQKRLKEKEEAKLKKDVAMREILETAERIAREEKRQKRQPCDSDSDGKICVSQPIENRDCYKKNIKQTISIPPEEDNRDYSQSEDINQTHHQPTQVENLNKIADDEKENHVRLPLNKEVAIVLTGRLEDSDFTSGSNLHFLNLIVNSSPREKDNPVTLNSSVSALMKSLRSSGLGQTCVGNSPRIIHNRLLTPTKYRTYSGRDCGTQTDGETEIIEPEQKEDDEEITKEVKEVVNGNKRDIDKSTNTGSTDDKNSRSKSQPRATLDSRPRWNANRPGTRYRTQSEKDPHYQKKLRLRRRRIESSDDRSRSPSPDRRKTMNNKTKIRNANRRRVKLENYDADLSMDSLHSVIPLRIDEHGKINIYQNNDHRNISDNNKFDTWPSEEILSQLEALKKGLLLKQQEWKTERSLVSPNIDF